jgi:hypothetical protein
LFLLQFLAKPVKLFLVGFVANFFPPTCAVAANKFQHKPEQKNRPDGGISTYWTEIVNCE